MCDSVSQLTSCTVVEWHGNIFKCNALHSTINVPYVFSIYTRTSFIRVHWPEASAPVEASTPVFRCRPLAAEITKRVQILSNYRNEIITKYAIQLCIYLFIHTKHYFLFQTTTVPLNFVRHFLKHLLECTSSGVRTPGCPCLLSVCIFLLQFNRQYFYFYWRTRIRTYLFGIVTNTPTNSEYISCQNNNLV